MCAQHNVRAIAVGNTDRGHTPCPRKEIKFPDPAGNRIRAAGLESRDSTDLATTSDIRVYTVYLICQSYVYNCFYHKLRTSVNISCSKLKGRNFNLLYRVSQKKMLSL